MKNKMILLIAFAAVAIFCLTGCGQQSNNEASFDPVALDQACVDLVYSAEDGQSLVDRIESRNGLHTLEQGEKIGLGSRTYELVDID